MEGPCFQDFSLRVTEERILALFTQPFLFSRRQLLALALGVLLTSGTRAGGLGEALRALLQDTRQVIRTSDGMVRVLELDPFSPGGDPLLSVHFLMQTALGQLVRAVGSGASLPGFRWPCHLLAVAVHRPLKFSVPQFPHL